MTFPETPVTIRADEVAGLLNMLRKTAKQLVSTEFKEFTGIIGELATCERLNYSWTPNSGYDATDKDGNRIQMKTRKFGLVPTFNKEESVDLVERINTNSKLVI